MPRHTTTARKGYHGSANGYDVGPPDPLTGQAPENQWNVNQSSLNTPYARGGALVNDADWEKFQPSYVQDVHDATSEHHVVDQQGNNPPETVPFGEHEAWFYWPRKVSPVDCGNTPHAWPD